jgi:hypothetical protein
MVNLFHPRLNVWNEHFLALRQSPFCIEGKTPIGRATVARLEMNSYLQLRAREMWIALRIF